MIRAKEWEDKASECLHEYQRSRSEDYKKLALKHFKRAKGYKDQAQRIAAQVGNLQDMETATEDAAGQITYLSAMKNGTKFYC